MLTNIIEQIERLVLHMEPHRSVRFLNLSPPCAARAARASSSGVLFAVIAGGAVIVLVEVVGVGFAAFGP